MRAITVAVSLALLAAFIPVDSWGQEGPTRVLFLTKSSTYEHSSISEKDGKPGHAQSVVQALADEHGALLTTTKDASLINKDNLQNYDLVIFYTSGDLTKAGQDGNPPMSKKGLDELLAWIRKGGAFMGYHSATDTFGHHMGDPALPYIKMIGGEFRTHGEQFVGTVRVVDPSHPAVASLPDGLRINEEWYMFRNLDKESIHVMALLDPGDERQKQEAYDIPSYPIIWCREYGEGRVYYNGMGHREDVWDNEAYQASFLDALRWVLGEAPAQAEPNFENVVPSADEE